MAPDLCEINEMSRQAGCLPARSKADRREPSSGKCAGRNTLEIVRLVLQQPIQSLDKRARVFGLLPFSKSGLIKEHVREVAELSLVLLGTKPLHELVLRIDLEDVIQNKWCHLFQTDH